MQFCPCGSGKKPVLCCANFITGKSLPATPEELMRSRYTAFYQRNFDYILNTMISPALDLFDINAAKLDAENIRWLRLKVVSALDNKVEYKAYYTAGRQQFTLHEISEFKLIDGKWFYKDGVHPDV
jgi:SEC-C motif-containing protein